MEHLSYICVHCFTNERKIDLVACDHEGYWHFVCSEMHSIQEIKTVGIEHVLNRNYELLPILEKIFSTGNGTQAERKSPDGWVFSKIFDQNETPT